MDTQASLTRIYGSYQQLKTNPHFAPLVKAVELVKSIYAAGKPDNIYVSFNGGKDATVALFLMFIALKELQKPVDIRCLYFEEPNAFDEMEDFINSVQSLLQLTIHRLKSKSYQLELTNFNAQHRLEYVVMGSRKSDPGCSKLGEIAASDVHKGYPDFTRVNPLIEWSCPFLWEVIQGLGLPYCSLYDDGYTSLGNKTNTKKNEHLLDKQTNTYLPASSTRDQIQRVNRHAH